jgi:hypothetical protein
MARRVLLSGEFYRKPPIRRSLLWKGLSGWDRRTRGSHPFGPRRPLWTERGRHPEPDRRDGAGIAHGGPGREAGKRSGPPGRSRRGDRGVEGPRAAPAARARPAGSGRSPASGPAGRVGGVLNHGSTRMDTNQERSRPARGRPGRPRGPGEARGARSGDPTAGPGRNDGAGSGSRPLAELGPSVRRREELTKPETGSSGHRKPGKSCGSRPSR